jgi:predicted enzyme related to lactoylglutathione lyase
MNRIVHFELGVTDPERAIKFYSSIFGWTIQKYEGPMPYWLVTTGDPKDPGINGGLVINKDAQPRTVNTIAVENLDESMKKVEGGGGKIVVPKTPIAGVGWLAYFTDTEGNILGLHQFDSAAK